MNAGSRFEIYFDFDNTITEFDVLDDVIQKFSVNEDWKEAEEEWRSGRIGSRECLERQFSQVRISSAALDAYVRTIRVDPAFPAIVRFLRARNIDPVILSDSFTSIIGPVLEHNGVPGIRVFSNEMRLDGDRPVLGFPFFGSICTRSGNCKCSHLVRQGRPAGLQKIYVGDGQSDVCPAGFCEILFAKGSLLGHYGPLRKDCIPFENLSNVFAHLQKLIP